MGSNVDIVRRLDDAFNGRDIETILSLSHSGFEAVSPGGVFRGEAGAREAVEVWWRAFPDCRAEILHLTAEGDVVIQQGTMRGTHTGVLSTPMGDIEPTGKPVQGSYYITYEFRDGKLFRQRLLFDRMELMEQLGLVPQAAAV